MENKLAYIYNTTGTRGKGKHTSTATKGKGRGGKGVFSSLDTAFDPRDPFGLNL